MIAALRRTVSFLFVSAACVLWAATVAGQMARDGSLGQTAGALSGPNYTIDVQNSSQQIRGNNLFHSFSEFNVNTGQTATFTGPNSIANIINRVTGQNVSNIDGAVNSSAAMPNANLFLMNPNGLVVGPNASFSVGGSIHLSTADFVRMGDGAQFFANLAKQSTLSSAPVTAFGFLGERAAGPITVQAGSPLAVGEGKSISLVGGDVSVSGRTISAPGGQISVASLTGAGEQSVAIAPSGAGRLSPESTNISSHGTIQLASGALLQTSSHTAPAGSILIKGGKLVMDNAGLEANTSSRGQSSAPPSTGQGNISVQVGQVALSNGSTIIASTSGDGKAGDIAFEVGTLRSNMGEDGLPLTAAAPVTIASNSTGQGAAGTIFLRGPGGQAAETVALSNTKVVASVSDAASPTAAPGVIEVTAEHVALANGTVINADTTGGADAGAITLNVGTLETQAGPEGRILLSSDSNCGNQCLGGQAGDITIQGIADTTRSETRSYAFILTPEKGPTDSFTYHLARNIDLQGTDIHSNAIGNAPGGMVIMRAQGEVSFTDTNISVKTQDFKIDGDKPSGELVRNQGFSRIDIMAKDIVLKNSAIRADAEVSDIGSCFLCQGGPSAGEIWLRVENSLVADNSIISNTGLGRAQAGITKIIKDNYFSYGAIGKEPAYLDSSTGTVQLTNSEVTVASLHEGLPGYLRIRADHIILDHSVLNSKVNNVTNVKDSKGQVIDVAGAGETGRVETDGRDVQGSVVISAKQLEIIGGGIIAPTLGSRIGNRIELHADQLATTPGNRPGGTLEAPVILDPADPARVVISSSSSGTGGAGMISISGESIPMPAGAPFPPASSIRLTGTDVLTDTHSDALGGKIELKATGPIELRNTTISANVSDVRPQSANTLEEGSNIHISAGNLSIQGGGISTLSRGTQTGGNVTIAGQGSITVSGTISASNTASGDAGSISIQTSGPIDINAGHVTTEATAGKGGSITIQGADVELNNGSAITAETHGVKNAGKVQLTSGNDLVIADSAVSTQALKASGGDIKLTAPNSVILTNSTLTASVGGGNETTGGRIDIDPQYVVIQNSNILAKAADGIGGRIAIAATQAVLVDPNSNIDATSSRGVSGQVLIQSPIQQLAGAIAPLPQMFAAATNLYAQRCAAQKGGHFSSFVQGARDGIPPQPGDLLASPLIFASDESSPSHLGSEISSNLAAARLGLPEFEQVSQIISAVPQGCRS